MISFKACIKVAVEFGRLGQLSLQLFPPGSPETLESSGARGIVNKLLNGKTKK